MGRKLLLPILMSLALPALHAQIPQAGGSVGAMIDPNGPVRLVYSAELSFTLLLGNLFLSDKPLSMLTLNLGSRFAADEGVEDSRFQAELVWFQGFCAGAGLTIGKTGGSLNLFFGELVPIFPWAVLVLYVRPIWESDGSYLTELGLRAKILIIPVKD